MGQVVFPVQGEPGLNGQTVRVTSTVKRSGRRPLRQVSQRVFQRPLIIAAGKASAGRVYTAKIQTPLFISDKYELVNLPTRDSAKYRVSAKGH